MAAALIAASALAASPSHADEPDGLYALAAGWRPKPPSKDAAVLKMSRAHELERWTLTASASRAPWDPTQPLGLISRVDPVDAVAGDSSRASLAFDWQRQLANGNLAAAAFATRRNVNLYSELTRFEGAAPAERFEQRDRRSLFGAAVRWSGGETLAGLPSATTLSARVRSEAIDAEGLLSMQGRSLYDVREDRMRQHSAGVVFENETQIVHGLRSVAGARFDTYRYGVASDLAGHGGSGSGSVLSPHLELIASFGNRTEAFAHAGRGFAAGDPRSPGAVFDPRTGAPLGRLDPLAGMAITEVGLRSAWARDASASISVFRATMPAELAFTGDTGFVEFARPTERRGLQLAAKYRPTPWLTLDLQAAALRARYSGGAREYVPGAAERNLSAGATMKGPHGWLASLFVTYFGARHALEDDGARLKASSFVNARLSRDLSKRSRVTLDVFNVFDRRVGVLDYFSTTRTWAQPDAGDSFLFNPAEPRGLRLKLRLAF